MLHQVLLDALNEHTVDAGAGVDAVASFDNVNVMAPRGRFEVEMYLSFLKLIGQVRSPRYCAEFDTTLHREPLACMPASRR